MELEDKIGLLITAAYAMQSAQINRQIAETFSEEWRNVPKLVQCTNADPSAGGSVEVY